MTTSGIDLHARSTGAHLQIGAVILEVTGLRNPCGQIEKFQKGLLAQVLFKAANGDIVRRAGIMAIVIQGETWRCHKQ